MRMTVQHPYGTCPLWKFLNKSNNIIVYLQNVCWCWWFWPFVIRSDGWALNFKPPFVDVVCLSSSHSHLLTARQCCQWELCERHMHATKGVSLSSWMIQRGRCEDCSRIISQMNTDEGHVLFEVCFSKKINDIFVRGRGRWTMRGLLLEIKWRLSGVDTKLAEASTLSHLSFKYSVLKGNHEIPREEKSPESLYR